MERTLEDVFRILTDLTNDVKSIKKEVSIMKKQLNKIENDVADIKTITHYTSNSDIMKSLKKPNGTKQYVS